jgi:hypothetical protein
MSDEAIPLKWIKGYTDTLLSLAEKFPEAGKMRDATLLRVDHVMDLVKAWKGRDKT